METIKDLWASLVAYANERSTNPLTSAFLLTWAGWNYKFFVVLFNGETSAEKFAAIAALYPRTEGRCPATQAFCVPLDNFWGSAFLYPALMTLFYVFVYPYVTSWVVTFYRRRQVEISNKLKTVEGTRVRSVEEVARMVREYEQKMNAADADQKAARAEAGALRNALEAAELEIKKGTQFNLRPTADEGEVINPAPAQSPVTPEFTENDNASIEFNIQRPGAPVGVESITVRQAKILTLLTEKHTFGAYEIPEYLNLRQADVDEDLITLKRRGAIDRTTSAVGINDIGRLILRSLMQQGKWAVQPRRSKSG